MRGGVRGGGVHGRGVYQGRARRANRRVEAAWLAAFGKAGYLAVGGDADAASRSRGQECAQLRGTPAL